MRWPLLIVLNAVLLPPGGLVVWAWQRGAIWGQPPSIQCIDVYRKQTGLYVDVYRFWLEPWRVGWNHLVLDPDAPLDGRVLRRHKFWVFEYEAMSIMTGAPTPEPKLTGGMLYYLWAPYWALLLICAVPAAPCWLLLRREWIRRRRKRHGLCLECGYDLRASKGRCPECGQTIALAQRAARS